MASPATACARFGGERPCPRDADAPRTPEGGVAAAALPAVLAAVTAGEGTLTLRVGEAAEILRGAGIPAPLDTLFAAAASSAVSEAARILRARAKAEAEAGTGRTF